MNLTDNLIENDQESMEQSEESNNGDVTPAKESKQQHSDHTELRMLPASIRKLDEDSSNSQESFNKWESEEPECFQFTDIAVLTAVFCSFCCPLCRYGCIVFEEDQNSKSGFSTLLLLLKCASFKVQVLEEFFLFFW